MSDQGNTVCRRNCWLAGGISAAVLWLALVMMAGYPPGQGLVIAAILFLLLSLFLIWAFCSGTEAVADQVAPAAAPPAPPAPPARAPTVPAAAPAPAPAPMPAAAMIADPVATAPVSPPAASAPMAVAAVTARPDPGTAAKPKAKAAKPAKAAAPKAATRSAAAPAEKPVAKPPATRAKAAKPRAAGLDAVIGRTKEAAPAEAALLQRPRGDKGDDLKLIVGVGPVLEKLMNGIGVWHFDQIAAWKAADIALVDSKMGSFRGRITRDGWVKQARNLARGKPPTGGAE